MAAKPSHAALVKPSQATKHLPKKAHWEHTTASPEPEKPAQRHWLPQPLDSDAALGSPETIVQLMEQAQPEDHEVVKGNAWKGKNRWIELGRKIRVYVYDLKVLKNNKDIVVDPQSVPNYGFETAFRKLLQESRLHRTKDPEQADYYYVPLDLCSIRTSWYQRPDKVQHMRALDKSVVEAMRKVGPYWDKRNGRHIVSSCRCPKVAAGGDELNPELWGRNTSLRLCLQTRVTGNRPTEAIDARRSLHVGYHVPGLETRLARGRRSTLAVYMGNPMNHYREKVSLWMRDSCSDCTSFDVETHANLTETLMEKYHKALRHARFSIEPPGETLERMSRDASVLAGAVPVILELPEGMPKQSLPWSPVLNWSRFSVNFTLTPEEAQGTESFVPRLEEKLRAIVESGEADRLQKGVEEAREKVTWTEEGALDTVMGMLAWRMAGMPSTRR